MAVRRSRNSVDIDEDFLSAVEKGDQKKVSSYIQRNPRTWKRANYKGDQTCLHLACDAKMARFLVSAGANIEASALGMTPFLSAASNGKEKVMEVLIENGCNIHEKTGFGDALVHACLGGHLEIVKRLIESGFDVNDTSNMAGNNSLHWTCWRNLVEITTEYLLSVGADIEAVNFCGRTPFLEAVCWGKERVMNCLIVNGCNIYAKDNERRGAIEIAAMEGHVTLRRKLVNIFSEREESIDTNIVWSISTRVFCRPFILKVERLERMEVRQLHNMSLNVSCRFALISVKRRRRLLVRRRKMS
ncbi:fibronectin type 3 and ankyrin repeat domains protein 1-like isoform X2 [Oscarella lobularis]|uniref:fibronectin type 3 and ankyrin repeat domains protein 1-like isoform X2 n=1 Tax=Oscarella lobularis TaxID=121494 RepID=UPI003313D880